MGRVVDPVNDAGRTAQLFVDTGCTYAASVLGRSLKSWALKNMSRRWMS